jgi:hypothetical protein
VALEEGLADLDDAPPVALERPRREEEPPAHPPPDREADVVADDRGRRGDGDHELDLQLVARGEDAGGEDRRLAGHRDAHRLDRDEPEEQGIADFAGDGHEACQHHRASTMPGCPP